MKLALSLFHWKNKNSSRESMEKTGNQLSITLLSFMMANHKLTSKKKGATWFWWILFIWSCSSLTTYSRILSCNYMDEAISCFVKLPSKIHDIFFNGGKCCYMIMYMVIIYALACPYIGRQEMRLVPIPIQYIFLAYVSRQSIYMIEHSPCPLLEFKLSPRFYWQIVENQIPNICPIHLCVSGGARIEIYLWRIYYY